ncbi:uncharacterized protein LOC132280024 [Cornus florida]|uniref:uncharacterized protein LOC132280024 n=1 Tax=Cornus florida TaxID=4283 RepID=UPI0028A03AC0|nr:uncharacterized protein LOC132280024 [Cornus florida]
MANSYDKQTIHEEENDMDGHEETVWASGCGCLRLFCFTRSRTNNETEDTTLLGAEHKETWLVKKLKKAKEVSEQLAGPKWKNLVRKISKYFNNKKSKTQFQYDPNSYALNFDDHRVNNVEEEDASLLAFSSRFATPFSATQERQPRL